MIGQTIGNYEILEELGRGGMGVVYKAHDQKLNRDVALKFLPGHLSASEQDKSRFIQEAQAASAINHPNICTIHDIQEHDGSMFIVMEYVQGQTLRDRVKTAAPSPKSAIEFGIQIADGLAAAHEKGIVHRDVKPENIMVRKDGIIQIMDFGLAKLRGVSRLTREGSTVGTAGYMSPEQIQGLEIDHRSDIFSLGVLLYELFTGQLPFKGIHETAIAYEIVNVEAPPMSSVRQEIDPALDAIILECIAKEPSERYQSAAEVAKELRRHKRESGRSSVTRVHQVRTIPKDADATAQKHNETRMDPRRRSIERWVWAAALAIVSSVALFLFLARDEDGGRGPQITRFTILPPDKTTINETVVSPDGRKIVFTAMGEGRIHLWLRPFDALTPQLLAETENAEFPFWSPDSRFIGFFADGKLKKIDASGGAPITICDAPGGFGASWSSLDEILFSSNRGLYLVSSGGGIPAPVTALDSTANEQTHRWPVFLPDGKRFLYTALIVADEATKTYLSSLEEPTQRKMILQSEVNVVLAPPAHLLFLKSRTLMSQAFDADQGVLIGEPRPIASDVGFVNRLALGDFSYSPVGVLTTGGGRAVNREYRWFDRVGNQLGSACPPGNYFDIALSPSGRHAAVQRVDIQTNNSDIWVIDLQRNVMSRFTFEPSVDDDPVWSPDGTWLYFTNAGLGTYNIFRKTFTGVGSPEAVTRPGGPKIPFDISRDGKHLLFTSGSFVASQDIWMLDIDKPEEEKLYIRSDFDESYPRFSPDGKWVAYCTDESGTEEVYVQSYSASGGRWQVSTNGGSQPRWRPDGRELFYVAPDLKLMSVQTRSGPTFDFDTPKELFQTRMDNFDAPNRYVVAENGAKFLINVPVGEEFANPVSVTIGLDAGGEY